VELLVSSTAEPDPFHFQNDVPASNPALLNTLVEESDALELSGLVTVTTTGPAACGGVVALIVVELPKVTLEAATPPK
jgi:hypothetical protein